MPEPATLMISSDEHGDELAEPAAEPTTLASSGSEGHNDELTTEDFPDEVLERILSLLDHEQLAQAALASTRFAAIARREDLWRALFLRAKGRQPAAIEPPLPFGYGGWRAAFAGECLTAFDDEPPVTAPSTRLEREDHKPHPVIKLVLLGDTRVGKSTAMARFAGQELTELRRGKRWAETGFVHTIGVDFGAKRVGMRRESAHEICLQIWDTAGEQRFRTISSAYLRGAMGILLCFDVTNRRSFDQLKNEFAALVSERGYSTAQVLVLGLKCEAPAEQRQVSVEEGQAFAANLKQPEGGPASGQPHPTHPEYQTPDPKEWRARYAECSPWTGEGLERAFYLITRDVLRNLPPKQQGEDPGSGPVTSRRGESGLRRLFCCG